MMNREEAKQAVRSRLEEYLNITTTKKGNQYFCPLCGSGTGKNKTPAGSVTDDKQYYHCFSCGFHGDIFNLIGRVEGITDFAGKFKRGCEIFNLQVEQPKQTTAVRADARLASGLSADDYSAYYKECKR